MTLKFFLVGIFCITQPVEDCVRVAATSYYETETSCLLAANKFSEFMKSQDPTYTTTMHCVSAYPIPEDKVSTYF